jgi:signal transduction histidine kinase/CheY-like chemotaxis protein
MTKPLAASLDLRVLVLAPTARDGTLTCRLLEEASIACAACTDIEALCAESDRGVGAVMLPEEAVALDSSSTLRGWLRRQPEWSDLPLLILSRPGADSASVALAMDTLGNVTVLERPMRLAALVSAVRSALRARSRQYQIREQLAERQRRLEALKEQAQRKDEFLAMLGHELRTPLAPLSNSLQILRQSRDVSADFAALREVWESQVAHMVRLVDDLLEVSRVTRGKIELRKEIVELAAVVEGAVQSVRLTINDAGHKLTVSLPQEPLRLEADPVRLTQVISNLLNNAAKYTEPGGQISLTARRIGTEATISVRDTGIGIPPQLLSTVFDLFSQVDQSRTRSRGGLGIGLALARKLVELHHGRLEAFSAGPAQGSEFVITLPCTTSQIPPPVAATEARNQLPRLPRHEVLVVDDTNAPKYVLAQLLKTLGQEVQTAASGAEALDRLRSNRFDMIISDIAMPGMDGLELARRIRLQPGMESVRLVALSGFGQPSDQERSLAAGFDRHLVKPISVDALCELLTTRH